MATRHRTADALARHALAMPEAWESYATVAPKTLVGRMQNPPSADLDSGGNTHLTIFTIPALGRGATVVPLRRCRRPGG